MDSDGEGDTLSKHQEEKIQMMKAFMKIYAQHMESIKGKKDKTKIDLLWLKQTKKEQN